MHITLNWSIGITKSEQPEFYTEEISSMTYTSIKNYPCLYYGCYFFNLLNARDIFELNPEHKKSFNLIYNEYFVKQAQIIAPQLIPNTEREFNNNPNTPITILYDILGFISFSYTYRIISFIKKISKNENRNNIENIKNILEKYRDILPSYKFPNNEGTEYAINNLTHAIEECTDNINTLAFRAVNSVYILEYQFFDEVLDELRKIIDSKLANEYCQYKDGTATGRCFATLKTPNGDKYISFSGFVDTEESTIINILNQINPKTPPEYPKGKFIMIIKKLCLDLNASLIQTTLDVKKYITSSTGDIQKSKSIRDLISNDSFTEKTKQTHACCERKIFAYFNDNIPDGELFIKMEPCGECYLGIKYLKDNGSKITWSFPR